MVLKKSNWKQIFKADSEIELLRKKLPYAKPPGKNKLFKTPIVGNKQTKKQTQ